MDVLCRKRGRDDSMTLHFILSTHSTSVEINTTLYRDTITEIGNYL